MLARRPARRGASVWAPHAAVGRGGDRRAAGGAGRGSAGDGRATSPGSGPAATTASRSTAGPPRPDPRSPSQPARRRTARPGVVDHGAFAWTDARLGGVRPARRPCSTSCTSARSRPRAPSTAPIGRLDHLVDLGRRRGRADAGRRVPRRPRLGLRRRRPVRAAPRLRRPRRAEAAGRRLPRPRPRRRARRRLQPPRPGRELPRRVRPVLHRPLPDPGATPSTSTGRAATRCGASSSTTPACGCATTTSTACGSTPSTPSSTSRPSTSSRSWPRRCDDAGGRARPAAVADRRERPQRPAARAAARAAAATGSTPPGPTTSTTRCTPCSPASATATTRTSARSRLLAKALRQAWVYDGDVLAAPRPASTAGRRRGCTARRFVVVHPEPRPGRQPGAGASGSAHLVSPGRRADRRRPAADRRRSCRCCSRARSGRRRRRSSTSPTTTTPSWAGPCREGRRREFAAFGWEPEDVPDPQDPATFAALGAALGRGRREPGTPSSSTGTGR